MHRNWRTWIVLAALCSAPCGLLADEVIPPQVAWRGVLEDGRLLKACPGSGIIADQASLKQLWTAWSLGPVPAVDFAHHVVIVVAARGGPQEFQLTYDGKGRARLHVAAADPDDPVCRFAIALFPRHAIAAIGEHELPAGTPLTFDSATDIRVPRFDDGDQANTGPAVHRRSVLTPAQAAKEAGTGTAVTVEFTVRQVLPLPPDGKHVRLISEADFKQADSFVVHLADTVVADLKVADLEKALLGRTIRASGTVENFLFSSTAEQRPGIRVVRLEQLEITAENAPTPEGERR